MAREAEDWFSLVTQDRGAVTGALRVPVASVALYALLIWALDKLGVLPGETLGSGSSSFLNVIGGVTGLLVAFRSNSSYERWYEGRRLWADIQGTSRNLMRTLSLALPPPSGRDDAVQKRAVQETLALIPAFAFALKLHLRDEKAIECYEVRSLLSSDVVERLEQHSTRASLPARPSVGEQDVKRQLSGLNNDSSQYLNARASTSFTSINIPLALVGQLQAALNTFHTTPLSSAGAPNADSVALDTATWASCLSQLNGLVEKVTAAERIRDTPIPQSLRVHMNRLMACLMLAIPLQCVRTLGFFTIPIAAMASFVYHGIDRISQELSDPFGMEPNDLPLDRYCADILREFREVAGEAQSASIAGTGVHQRIKSA